MHPMRSSRRSPFPLFTTAPGLRLPLLLVFALAVLLGACDRMGVLEVDTPPTPAPEEISYTTVPDVPAANPWGDAPFGCTGGIWVPKKGEYRPIHLKINLPKKTVEAAGGAVYKPRFALYEENDPDGQVLMGVICTLPEIDDPKVEKAHEHVAKKLGKDVRKLQREMEKMDETTTAFGVWGTAPTASVAPDTLGGATRLGGWSASLGDLGDTTSNSCVVVLVDVFYLNGIRVEVYDSYCGGGGGGSGGGDDGGIGGGGGGSGGDGRPRYCDTQLVPTPECGGGGGSGPIGDGPYATPWDALDFISLAWSIADFIDHPTWKNALYVGADAIGAALPVIPSAGTIRRGARILSGDQVWGMYSDLKRARQGIGNFGLPARTRVDAEVLGLAWVGEGYRVASDGRTLISANELKQYRPPSWKQGLGRYQANLEWRHQPSGPWPNNAHIDILDP